MNIIQFTKMLDIVIKNYEILCYIINIVLQAVIARPNFIAPFWYVKGETKHE